MRTVFVPQDWELSLDFINGTDLLGCSILRILFFHVFMDT